MRNAIEQFRDEIRSAGLIPPDMIEPDGKLHRFASNGKRGDDAGWYALHDDGIPAGVFGDWRNGFSQTWRADIGRKPTPAEDTAHRAKLEALQREREAEEKRKHAEAASKATAIWKSAKAAPADHPYLLKKSIPASGAKLHGDALVIPMRDGCDIHSLQFIGPDGDKRFLTGGRISGCYFSIGNPKGAAALCIAEGFATGATIHAATGYPVAVAFNAGNLGPVTKAMRAKFPDLPLILCADDDKHTEGNPGLTKATEAARSVGGLLAIPDFGKDRQEGQTDFNDMAVAHDLEAVKQAIAGILIVGAGTAATDGNDPPAGDSERFNSPNPELVAVTPESDVTDVTGVQPCNGGPSGVTADETPDVTGVTDGPTIPDADLRPCFKVFDDWTPTTGSDKKLKPGVYQFGIKSGKRDEPRRASR
jgi:putative DNA primase/helicase